MYVLLYFSFLLLPLTKYKKRFSLITNKMWCEFSFLSVGWVFQGRETDSEKFCALLWVTWRDPWEGALPRKGMIFGGALSQSPPPLSMSQQRHKKCWRTCSTKKKWMNETKDQDYVRLEYSFPRFNSDYLSFGSSVLIPLQVLRSVLPSPNPYPLPHQLSAAEK